LGVAPNTIPLFEEIGRHHAVVSCGGGSQHILFKKDLRT
jgi:hypothetical protein